MGDSFGSVVGFQFFLRDRDVMMGVVVDVWRSVDIPERSGQKAQHFVFIVRDKGRVKENTHIWVSV